MNAADDGARRRRLHGALAAMRAAARSPSCCAWRAAGYPDTGDDRRRQARYEGSDRQTRGAVLKALRDAAPQPMRIDDVIADWPDAHQRDRAIDSLIADGLAEASDGLLSLPGHASRALARVTDAAQPRRATRSATIRSRAGRPGAAAISARSAMRALAETPLGEHPLDGGGDLRLGGRAGAQIDADTRPLHAARGLHLVLGVAGDDDRHPVPEREVQPAVAAVRDEHPHLGHELAVGQELGGAHVRRKRAERLHRSAAGRDDHEHVVSPRGRASVGRTSSSRSSLATVPCETWTTGRSRSSSCHHGGSSAARAEARITGPMKLTFGGKVAPRVLEAAER